MAKPRINKQRMVEQMQEKKKNKRKCRRSLILGKAYTVFITYFFYEKITSSGYKLSTGKLSIYIYEYLLPIGMRNLKFFLYENHIKIIH